MKELLESQIRGKRFNLDDMIHKIDTFWVIGKITEEERTMLLDLARKQAEPSQESDVWTKIYELEARIKVLEGSDNPADLEVIEDWKEGKWYHNGDKCFWNGKTYICANVPENSVCVWSPETMPQYWTEIVSETNEG